MYAWGLVVSLGFGLQAPSPVNSGFSQTHLPVPKGPWTPILGV